MLSQRNSHPRDARIEFYHDTHTYVVDGSSDGIVSTTTFIHHYFPTFDAKRVVKYMKNKKEKYPGLTDDQIVKKWSEDGKKSSTQGTSLHQAVENFYNHIPNTKEMEESTQFKHFLAFHETVKDRLTPYRTEWSIFDGEIDLAGQLDMLYKKDDGTFGLYDWKCVKEIKKTNPYEKGLGICSSLDHCNFYHYSLQLHVYKRILETRYDINVTEMKLVVLHPDQPTYLLYDISCEKNNPSCGGVADYVENMFNERRSTIQ
jgi:ATP-dependent exoDNAse (exonuclease V) beta subunit